MWWLNRNKKSIFIFILIILSCMPAVLSLFRPGFFQSDDGEWMIIRFSAFHEAFRDGQFPVRFLGRLNHGYGYPVANFLYPGFMYIAEPIHLLGFGFVDSIKIVLALSMIGSAIFCYLWLAKKFVSWSAFVGAVIYLYAPYHLFDVYKRGSVGEILALCVIPFCLWQIERKSFFWTSLGIAFLILSHNTLAILFLPIIIVYRFLSFYSKVNKKYLILNTLSPMLIGLGLSAFFWLPAIFDLRYTIFSQTRVSNWQDHFADLGLAGLVSVAIFVLVLLYFFKFRPIFSFDVSKHWNYSSTIRIAIFMFLTGTVSVILSLSISSILWQFLPVAFVQFPFRSLSITILSVAFLSAVIINQLKDNLKVVSMIMLFLLLGFSAMPYMKPAGFFDKGDSYYATNEDTTTVQNEYMPKWVKNNPKEHFKNKVEITSGKITNLKLSSNRLSFTTNSPVDSLVTINTIYYPGWKTQVDGRSVPILYNNDRGVVKIKIKSGQHYVGARFTETPVRSASNFISLISLLVLFLISKIIPVKKE